MDGIWSIMVAGCEGLRKFFPANVAIHAKAQLHTV
jgi:hypothetical protein